MPREQAGRVLDYRTAPARGPGRYLPLSIFALAALLTSRRLRRIAGGSEPAAKTPAAGRIGETIAGAEAPPALVPAGPSDLVRRLLGRQVRVFVAGRSGAFSGTVAGRSGSLLILSDAATPTYIDLQRITAIGALPSQRQNPWVEPTDWDWEETEWDEEDGFSSESSMGETTEERNDEDWEEGTGTTDAEAGDWESEAEYEEAEYEEEDGTTGEQAGALESESEIELESGMGAELESGMGAELESADGAQNPDPGYPRPPAQGAGPWPAHAPPASGLPHNREDASPRASAPRCGRRWQLIHIYRPWRRGQRV